MSRRLGLVLLALLALSPSLSACAFVRGYAEGQATRMLDFDLRREAPADIGMIRFLYDDLGNLNTDTLNTNALPWKVTAAALVLDATRGRGAPVQLDTLNTLLGTFGFIVPSSIENWSRHLPPPTFDKPMGIVTGYVRRSVPPIELEAANLGCAACHAGVLYDRTGRPDGRVWLGLPNTSLNLEAYSQAVYRSLKNALRSRGELLDTVRRLFPELTPLEMHTLQHYVIPQMVRRLTELERAFDAPTPFGNGGPGLTNGVAALKFQLGVLPAGTRSDDAGNVSIPDLGSVFLRTSLLIDGFYGPPGVPRFRRFATRDLTDQHMTHLARIVSFFTVPAMGVRPERARKAIPQAEEIVRFIKSYRPPPFPGPVDAALAMKGRDVYHANCARCHGTYSEGITDVRLIEFPNRLSPQEEMNTDPDRWRMISPELVRAIRASAFKDDIAPEATKGYVAPRLTSLWATAPYLHNGSVPTLWHLMHPEERPERFYVGGHRLDFTKVGIDGVPDAARIWRYPEGYIPWATPALYDTRKPGQSNRGHEREFGSLSQVDKQGLLEYLKLL